MTVSELLERVSSRELTEWAAYFKLEQLGMNPNERADLRAGIVASTVYNVNRGKSKPLEPAAFMPKYEKAKQSPEELHARMLNLAARRPAAKTGEAAPNGDPR